MATSEEWSYVLCLFLFMFTVICFANPLKYIGHEQLEPDWSVFVVAADNLVKLTEVSVNPCASPPPLTGNLTMNNLSLPLN